ncbi:MAG: dicarboxylate/amino acid:cation symporter [Planctomycetota bacterium]
MHWQILVGLVIGAIAGLLVGVFALQAARDLGDAREAAMLLESGGDVSLGTSLGTFWAYTVFDLVGDLFLNGLKLIIVPLVTSSILLAVANLGGGDDFGRLGTKTLGYYLFTSLIAILIGLVLVNTFTPGTADDRGILVGEADVSKTFASEAEAVSGKTEGKTGSDFLNVFRQMVPPNLIAAAADGQLLGLIVVSMIVGYMTTRLPGPLGDVFMKFVQAVYELSLMVTHLVLRFAPIGVFGLIAATMAIQFAKLYPNDDFMYFIAGIGKFAGVAAGALLLHFLVTMPLILSFVARVNPLRHYAAMSPALLTAFSTSSSSSTLPLTMECVEDRAGVSNRVASFTLPLGATVNMDGTALYECVAAIFICQAFGVDLSIAQQFLIVVVALLTSVGVAGVPSASLVAIAVILGSVQSQITGLPQYEGVNLLAGMALLFVFDRPLDMMRTAVNIFSDSVAAVTIARSEGETDVLATPMSTATS